MRDAGRSLALIVAMALLLAAAACGGNASGDAAASVAPPASLPAPTGTPPPSVAETFKVASWNLEWFGDLANGPADETLQLNNVATVIDHSNADVWGLQEVCSGVEFSALKARLPGYAGFLANESTVVDGATYYSDFANGEQKVGLLYKASVATPVDARIILGDHDYDFAGRPPMQVTLSVTLNGTTQAVVLIVMHSKSGADASSYLRRVNASAALKSYLDATFTSGQSVMVVGDFNDDLDVSVAGGLVTPYQNFLDDPVHGFFPTMALTLAGTSTLTMGGPTLDHHYVRNLSYVAGSVTLSPASATIPAYAATTSDHYPVVTQYHIGG